MEEEGLVEIISNRLTRIANTLDSAEVALEVVAYELAALNNTQTHLAGTMDKMLAEMQTIGKLSHKQLAILNITAKGVE